MQNKDDSNNNIKKSFINNNIVSLLFTFDIWNSKIKTAHVSQEYIYV